MITPRCLLAAIFAATVTALSAHETGTPHADASTPLPVHFEVETQGPVSAPGAIARTPALLTSGQGFWKFAPARGTMPVPAEAQAFVKGAHGTIIVDRERDVAYWGLEKVGWVAFSNRLTKSWIVKGDPAISSGNLHGADIMPRAGQLPLVIAADNVEGEILVSDTTFQQVEKLKIP